MIRFKPLFLIAFLFSVFTSVNSQNLDLPTAYIRNSNSGKNKIPANVKGSPFINENFTSSQLIVNNKKIKAQLRYDAYTDAFEVKQSNGSVYLSKNPQISINYLNNNYYLIEYYNDSGILKMGYLQSMVENEDIKVYKRDVKIFEEGEEAINSYAVDKPAKFEEEVRYYLALNSDNPKEIRLKRRDIIRFFDNKKVKNFIKDEKLKFKDENDLIELADYYNKMHNNEK
ncbi:hypothetical protein [Gramella sp. Hel_I_59]|uniref:hypothetical protein n=1 Tax=Gramella sp. Hel_I_59 TaxID=1249978 RepID=UPI001154762D|nr:hypothetical protein [Gramella sp. Hel_I_59]